MSKTVLCGCGCGTPAPIADKTDRAAGYVKGEPRTFVHGHNARRGAADYEVVDTGYASPCWVWARSINKTGYAMMSRARRRGLAHRWFYEQARGAIEPGLTLDHLCRVRRCVNPAHMEAVDLRENIWRGWEARYGAVGHSDMRASRLALRLSQRAFAGLLGVTQTTVSAWERGLREPPVDWSSRLRIDEREVIGGVVYGKRAES